MNEELVQNDVMDERGSERRDGWKIREELRDGCQN